MTHPVEHSRDYEDYDENDASETDALADEIIAANPDPDPDGTTLGLGIDPNGVEDQR